MQLGIDYGTTTTLVSLRRSGASTSQLIDIGSGSNRLGYEKFTIPSIIAMAKKGYCKIGYEAAEIGKTRSDEAVILRSMKKCLACDLTAIKKGTACWNPFNQRFCEGSQRFRLFGSIRTASELVSEFIRQLLQIPEVKSVFSSPRLENIGISVPAAFGSDPRLTVYNILLRLTEDKKKIDVINEPTAAIMACKGQGSDDEDGIYVMCDVGGGTTDIVVYEKKDKESYFLFRPKGLQVAGDDVDAVLLEHLMNHYVGSSKDSDAALVETRRAKELLSLSQEVTVLGRKLTRERFEEIVGPVLAKIVDGLYMGIIKVFDDYKPFSQTGKYFRLKKVYLSGGGAKIPLLKRMIERKLHAFGPQVDFITNPLLSRIYADDVPIVVVALGTAMPKKGISDSIQYMLPYTIFVKVGDAKAEVAKVYSELPLNFSASRSMNISIELLAYDPSSPNVPVYDLVEELVSTTETGEELLSDFLDRYRSFKFTIDKYNRLIVEALSPPNPRRPFPMPWQGGIEGPLFDKYRQEWRRQHGYV